jgi:hypothetical protein
MATKKKTSTKKGQKGRSTLERKAGAARKAGRRVREQKPAGSPTTRQMVRQIGKRILDFCADCTPVEGAKQLGLDSYDIKNLRAGNLPSLDMVIKLVRDGHFSPKSILLGKKLEKLQPKVSTQAVQQRLINNRVRALAASKPAQEWGKATGLAVHSIYQLRVAGARAGIHTVLGFMNAGVSIDEIMFGKKPGGKE